MRHWVFLVSLIGLIGCGRQEPAKAEAVAPVIVKTEAPIRELSCAERKEIADLMLNSECHPVAVQILKDMARDKKDKALDAALLVMMKHVSGVELISHAFHRLLIGAEAEFFNRRMERILDQDTRDHVYARAYYLSLASKDVTRSQSLQKIVANLAQPEKMQIIGYALFLNSVDLKADYRTSIIAEAEKMGLTVSSFEGSSDEIARLKSKLDEVVIGQESAKVALAVAVRNHYQRLKKGLKKSNILVLGPSGTGKTLMVQTIAASLDVPFAVADASSITQAGYIGGKVKDAVTALAQKAEFDLKKIEQGIIFFDEIDKMAARSGRADNEEFKRQAQATLLKIIEGIEVEVSETQYRKITIDTSKILFVCAGAFTGLADIVAARLEREQKVKPFDVLSLTSSEDLIAFGMTAELLGRLPNLLTLKELNVNDLKQILNNPHASILEEYKTLFAIQDIELSFTPGAVQALAEKASEFRIGARALRTVVERVMADLQFRIGHMGSIQSCTITERVIRYGDLPQITYRIPGSPHHARDDD